MSQESFNNKQENIITIEGQQFTFDKDGFVKISEIALKLLGRQGKNISAFLDGEGDISSDIYLGEGLSYLGDSGNYSDMKLYKEDIPEFVRRIREYYGE